MASDNRPTAETRGFDELMDRRVTINVMDVPRRRALAAAARSARATMQYQDQLLDAYRDLVTVHVQNVPLRDVLDRILAGTSLVVVPDGPGQLAVVERSGRQGQPTGGSIAGRVTDSANGAGVRGAMVQLLEVNVSTVTGSDGGFVLRGLPSRALTVKVRLFGYQPVTRQVVVRDTELVAMNVALAPLPTVLSGVVTTATGTQRKLEVGSDIATLNVDSIMKVAPITSVTDLLEARVPGVTVQRTSGVPGAPARIRLRGVGSPTLNNDPIVVVDGVRVYAQQSDPRNSTVDVAAQSPVDQIDPNSIETLEVLRGPSASAMYGSDAANGVIVITTKRGRAGPTRVSATLGQGFSFQPGQFPVGIYRFGHDYNGPTRFCALSDPFCTVDSVVAFQALNDPRFAVTTAHGSTRELSGTASGGVGALTYALTGSFGHTTGQLELPDLEAERFTTFHGFAPPGWMRRPLQYTTAGGSSRLDLPLGGGRGRSGMVSLTSSVFKSDQQLSSLTDAIAALMSTYVDTTQLGAAPLLSTLYKRVTSGDMNVTNAVTLTWPVTAWLPLTATGGMNLLNTTQQSVLPRDYKLDADSVGSFSVYRGSTAQYTLNVNTTMPAHWARTAAGFNFTNNTLTDITASVTGLPIGVMTPTSFTGLVPGQNTGQTQQASTGASTYGWFVAPTLNLHSRFFATPGLRLDGGSASGTRVSAGGIPGVSGFPKMDFAWLAVDPSGESKPRGVPAAVSLLRLRGAFGTAGRQPDPAAQLRLFSSLVIPGPGSQSGLDGVQLQTLGNTTLRPERSRELEYGLDAEVWQGRVALGVTGARKTTQDAIISVTLPPSVVGSTFQINTDIGANHSEQIQRNIGVTRNTDLEVTARAIMLQRAAMLWDIGATLTRSSSLLVRLDPSVPELVVSGGEPLVSTRLVAGYPMNGLWARPIVGYADNNGDGIIQANEVLVGDSVRYLGQPLPTYEATVNTNLALLNGRLTAHTTLAYQHGMTQYNAAGAGHSNACNNEGVTCYTVGTPLFGNDPSAPLSQQAAFAALTLQNPTAYGLVQTVSVLRWQSLSVNYVAPQAVAQLFRTPRLTLALQGSNLGLHTNYHGKDPNVNAFSSGERIQDTGQLPMPRTFTLRLTLGN